MLVLSARAGSIETMDPVSVAFYAIVCGLLAGLLPARLGRAAKIATGLAVGILSATALPLLRTLVGL